MIDELLHQQNSVGDFVKLLVGDLMAYLFPKGVEVVLTHALTRLLLRAGMAAAAGAVMTTPVGSIVGLVVLGATLYFDKDLTAGAAWLHQFLWEALKRARPPLGLAPIMLAAPRLLQESMMVPSEVPAGNR